MTTKKPGAIVHSGEYWGRRRPGGPLEPASAADGPPDAWICRRVVDFPHQRVPPGGATGVCTRCGAVIVYNPARTVDAPKVCMQCADIQPLPFPEVQ